MEADGSIVRITNGNFRVLQRLFSQIERIMQINDLKNITKEVVETYQRVSIGWALHVPIFDLDPDTGNALATSLVPSSCA
ncbi:hypothetical protein [Paenibacillus sp. MBLB4367]|uniref:hypothetical protein n=1 Tax=Paenibacillus sp. MBLB4367 TaxID=3384767 RepID=UPI003907ECFE